MRDSNIWSTFPYSIVCLIHSFAINAAAIGDGIYELLGWPADMRSFKGQYGGI